MTSQKNIFESVDVGSIANSGLSKAGVASLFGNKLNASEVAAVVAFGAFLYQGKICMSTERLVENALENVLPRIPGLLTGHKGGIK
jgi:hypothetical protein